MKKRSEAGGGYASAAAVWGHCQDNRWCYEVMQVGGCSMLLQNLLRQPGKDVI